MHYKSLSFLKAFHISMVLWVWLFSQDNLWVHVLKILMSIADAWFKTKKKLFHYFQRIVLWHLMYSWIMKMIYSFLSCAWWLLTNSFMLYMIDITNIVCFFVNSRQNLVHLSTKTGEVVITFDFNQISKRIKNDIRGKNDKKWTMLMTHCAILNKSS